MAPPTVPTEIKRKRGTLRADRTPNTSGVMVSPAGAVDPPPSLKEAGAREWTHALKVCTWIASSDLTALRMLCEAIDRREALAAVLDKEGASIMLETSTGYAYTNPALISLDKVEERISKWMSQLGMTPSARGALGVAEVAVASTLDKLAQRRKTRQAGLPDTSPESAQPPSERATARTSSSSLTHTDGSPRTVSQDRRGTRSTRDRGSDASSETRSPATH